MASSGIEMMPLPPSLPPSLNISRFLIYKSNCNSSMRGAECHSGLLESSWHTGRKYQRHRKREWGLYDDVGRQ